MQFSWKKLENDKGYPFYYNEVTKDQQWDHPEFGAVKHQLESCNYIKYSKYRLAFKFRTLQKALFMDGVSLDLILGVFYRHKLGTNESSLCLESYDLEAVLYDIYFAASKTNHKEFDIDHAVELMQNFLYNIYDKERQVKIQVSSTKLVLAILSDCDLREIYNFIFHLCSDHNNCVTRLRLQAMLSKLVEIFALMHEDVVFGHHLINSTVESCFSNSPGLVGLNESNFLTWLDEAPLLLGWISMIQKVKSSETVLHNAKCITCKASPLIGLMYRCLKCSKYLQCQRCFLSGKINNSHKISHTMKEYSTSKATSSDFGFNFIKKLHKFLQCSVKLNVSDINSVPTTSQNTDKDCLMNQRNEENCETIVNLKAAELPQEQLQHVILQMEHQNRELHRLLTAQNHNETEVWKYLEDHRVVIDTQITKLKILRDSLTLQKPIFNLVESTPRTTNMKKSKSLDFGNILSPIESMSVSNEEMVRGCTTESVQYSINDISTWIKDQGPFSKTDEVDHIPVKESHNALDDALTKLQQILAINFTLEDSLCSFDNSNLKQAVSEVEGMLTSIIDNAESGRASAVELLKDF